MALMQARKKINPSQYFRLSMGRKVAKAPEEALDGHGFAPNRSSDRSGRVVDAKPRRMLGSAACRCVDSVFVPSHRPLHSCIPGRRRAKAAACGISSPRIAQCSNDVFLGPHLPSDGTDEDEKWNFCISEHEQNGRRDRWSSSASRCQWLAVDALGPLCLGKCPHRGKQGSNTPVATDSRKVLGRSEKKRMEILFPPLLFFCASLRCCRSFAR